VEGGKESETGKVEEGRGEDAAEGVRGGREEASK